MRKSSSKIQSRKSSYIQDTEPNFKYEIKITKELKNETEMSVEKNSKDNMLDFDNEELVSPIPQYLRSSKKTQIQD